MVWSLRSIRSLTLRSDRKSTRLNSSHGYISYAVFCLKKKNIETSGEAISCSHIGAERVQHVERPICLARISSTSVEFHPGRMLVLPVEHHERTCRDP